MERKMNTEAVLYVLLIGIAMLAVRKLLKMGNKHSSYRILQKAILWKKGLRNPDLYHPSSSPQYE